MQPLETLQPLWLPTCVLTTVNLLEKVLQSFRDFIWILVANGVNFQTCLSEDKPCKSHLWVVPGTHLILDVSPSLPQSWCQVHIQWQPFTWCHLLGAEESLTLQAVHLICSSSVNFHVPPCPRCSSEAVDVCCYCVSLFLPSQLANLCSFLSLYQEHVLWELWYSPKHRHTCSQLLSTQQLQQLTGLLGFGTNPMLATAQELC